MEKKQFKIETNNSMEKSPEKTTNSNSPQSQDFESRTSSLLSSFSSAAKVEDTYKRLPPSMKRMLQTQFKHTLIEIHEELRQYIKFVEDVQRETPSEWEVITITTLGQKNTTLPGSSANSKDDRDLRGLTNVDSRPTNAPLRDAFQIVRNLIAKISHLIDKTAFTSAVTDDSNLVDVRSSLYSIYYGQYVFQIACYLLKMIGEHLTKFSCVLGETSMNGSIDELPISDYCPANPNMFLHRKDHSYCPANSSANCSANANNKFLRKENPYNIVSSNTKQAKNVSFPPDMEVKKRISDAIELLETLSERMMSLDDSEFTDDTEYQKWEKSSYHGSDYEHKEPKNNHNNKDDKEFLESKSTSLSNEKREIFHDNKYSVFLKEELKKNLYEYSKSSSENSGYSSTIAIVNLFIKSFRATNDEKIFKIKNEKFSETEKERQLNDMLEVFVNETYEFTMLSLSEEEMCKIPLVSPSGEHRGSVDITKKELKKADTEPKPITVVEKVIKLPKQTSSTEIQDRTGIEEIRECPSCPQALKFKLSEYLEINYKDLFPVKNTDDFVRRSSCSEKCLTGQVLHENHDLLPQGKMEVRQVNERGNVVVTLEDYDPEAEFKELINCTALLDLREGPSRKDMTPDLSSKILREALSKLSSPRQVDEKYLMQTTSHSDLIPVKKIEGTGHDKTTNISEIVDKMYDLGEKLRNAGYKRGPPLVLKLSYENVEKETFKTLTVPSRIPLSFYQKILFHIYYKDKESEVEDFTDEAFPILGENFFIQRVEGLFSNPSNRSMLVYPNPAAESHLEQFRFIGILLAIAIIQNEYLGVKLPLCFYKCLLDRWIYLHDLQEIDPVLHQKLKWLNENNISGRKPMFNFTIKEQVGKEEIVTELIDNGKEVTVTETNKMVFIEKSLKRKIVERCLEQFTGIINGFKSVLEPRYLSEFKVEEIQKIIEQCPCLSESEITKHDSDSNLKKKNSM